jgi:hypothetical protein
VHGKAHPSGYLHLLAIAASRSTTGKMMVASNPDSSVHGTTRCDPAAIWNWDDHTSLRVGGARRIEQV